MNPWELHPALVHMPIALLLSATFLDVVAVWRRRDQAAKVAMGLLVAGELTAIVAAGAGILAYFTIPAHTAEAHLHLLIHPTLAVSSVLLYAIVAFRRRKTPGTIPGGGLVVVSLVAASLLIAAGALGGRLVFHDGVGVAPQSRDALDAHHH